MQSHDAESSHNVDWKTWLIRQFLYDERPAQEYTSFASLLGGIFKRTYEPDGFDGSYNKQVTAPDIEEAEKHNFYLTRFFAGFISFIGLPDRRTRFEYKTTGKDHRAGSYYYGLSLTQFGKNLIGGWDSRLDISNEKKFWQYLSLFLFKIPLILPLNLLIFPFKFFLNIIKTFTEIIPLLISHLLALSVNWALHTLQSDQRNHEFAGNYDDFEKIETTPDPKNPEFMYTADEVIPHLELRNGLSYWMETIGLLASIVVLGVLNAAGRMLAFVGRAMTSPAKNVRMAFTAGREVEGKALGIVLGLIGAGLSIVTTVAIWFIALPFTISAIITYIPAISQAILGLAEVPFIASMITALSQMPIVIASTSAIAGTLSSLGIALTTVFGPALISLAAFIGLQLTEGLIITCTAISFIATLSSVVFNLLSHKISDTINLWKNGGPIHFIFGLKMTSPAKGDLIPLDQEEKKVDAQPLPPSPGADSVVQRSLENDGFVSNGLNSADKIQKDIKAMGDEKRATTKSEINGKTKTKLDSSEDITLRR